MLGFSFPLISLLAAATPLAATPHPITMTPAPLPAVNFSNAATVVKTPLAANLPWLTHTLAGIFVVLAFQTTKQEGLSGTIGGRVESAYRPRLGFDQQMARTTSWVAIGFVFFG